MEVSSAFTAFMAEAEPRLRRALVARHGMQRGRDATLDAMVYAWRHWERVSAMDNPVGYLYRVGSSSVKPSKALPLLAPVNDHREPWIEPGLEASLDMLSGSQRVAVVLRHSFDWTHDEIAELLDVSVRTVRSHLERGMSKLRSGLEVSVDG
jgi:DNA-directed RNA polymerase specialized sigma24 family protein